MSYRAYAAYATIIDEKQLSLIGKCGELLEILDDLLDELGYSLLDLAYTIEYGDGGDIEPSHFEGLEMVYNCLIREFKNTTKLTLNLSVKNEDDDNTPMFEVYGCTKETKEYKAFKKKYGDDIIEYISWVTWG